ncbi:VENN motif pre-toxin domain-containing protein, partial [Pasteurella multocida]
AENVHLKGAVIASTNPAQSELTTNRFSFEDIKNESSYSASSASISGGYSKGREYYRDADTHKVVSAGSKNAEFIAGKKGANFNAGLPMHSEGSEESLTKATLTAGRITLNKDSQPIETTADALGINTDLSQAQREVSKPKDVTQLLAEQKEIAKAVGEIKSAVEIYTSNQQEEAEQTGNQAEITQKQTALLVAEEAQAKWGDKGEYKRTAERLTTLLTGILAKQAAGGIATQLISPEVNQWIKEATTNDKGETDKIANTLAHAIWGAIEATANRGNPTSGAIAAASAELAAPMLAKVLYNKDKAEQLTAEEKAQITALSSITAAVAGGLTAQGSRQSNTTVSSLTHASIGGEIGKIAVENNYLEYIKNPEYLSSLFLKAEGDNAKRDIEAIAQEKATEKIVDKIDEYSPHYVSINGQVYGIGVKTAMNLRNGDIIVGGNFSPLVLPNRLGASVGANLGWVVNLESSDMKNSDKERITGKTISKFMRGFSIGASGCYKFGCIGYSQSISTDPKDKKYYSVELGVGVGASGVGINEEHTFKIGTLGSE